MTQREPDENCLMSQRDAAEILGVCQQRVWAIERRAIKKLAQGFLRDPVIREYIRLNCIGISDDLLKVTN